MLQNAKFNLALVNNKTWCRSVEEAHFLDVNCQVESTFAPGIWDETNYKICKMLEMRLAEQLPSTEWKLRLEFSTAPSGFLKVTASGKILEHLHSLMSYGAKDSELKLMFSAHFYSQNRTTEYRTTVLHPLVGSENCFDHSTYLDTETEGSTAFLIVDWLQLDDMKIWIKGIEKKIKKTYSPDFMQLLRDNGFGSELTLQYKVVNAEEDNSPIRVHENILIAQSSVIKTLLETDNFAEGATRTISMTNWTKQEVTAFVHFLYFGDLKMALNNSKLAVTLYEMAHYYDVTSLERVLKTVLLNMTSEAEPWKPDDCIRVFNIADSAKDCGLKQMAVDMFKLYTWLQSNGTSSEGSSLLNEVMAVMPQEMFLMFGK